ncbi:MAG: zinc metalloprotease HtpX [Brevinematales bacterium]|nr:zinc metalloprotease HtpX [Brevinematales bacterium]
MFSLTMRMLFVLGALFGILYLVIAIIGQQGVIFNIILASVILLIQYLIAPKIVEWTMGVRYVSENEYPELHRIVEEMAERAGIPKPKVGISSMPIANAFAFGRSIRDGRVVVTEEIMRLLTKDELRAVIGHEVSHIKHRDMLVTTLVSVIPMVLYNLAMFFMYFGGGNNRESNLGIFAGIFLLLLYFISNLLVLAVSRIREYLADYGSVKLGNPPEHLASALYKLVYSSATTSEEERAQVSGIKAFFLNDPNSAENEIMELAQLDTNRNFKIDRSELEQLRVSRVRISATEKIMELFTTHPNMLKRIKKLSEYV